MNEAALADISKMSAFQLARLADVQTPDGPSSAGAEWLSGVRGDFVEGVELGEITSEDDLAEVASNLGNEEFTHGAWMAFVDLCLYREPDLLEGLSLSEDSACTRPLCEQLKASAFHHCGVKRRNGFSCAHRRRSPDAAAKFVFPADCARPK